MTSADNTGATCALCGDPATLRCSNCRQQFYCKKDHQKEDWMRHRIFCRVWEIRETPELGRHLIATRDLAPGEIVITENPLTWGPALHTGERVCVGCGKSNATARCVRCAWPACSQKCEGLLDDDRHGAECALLEKARIIPRCDVLLVLRVLLLRRRSPKKWALLSSLQSHEEARGPGTEAHQEMQEVARALGPLFTLDPSSREILPKVCGLIDVNALETNPPQGCAALYEVACLLEHRCISNTRHGFSIDFKGRPCISVTAVTSIKKGEHLSTTYTHALWATRARRDHLMATKYFACRCERCADPTELQTHLGTLVCPCGPGLVLPKDPLDSETEWSCTSCPGVLTSAEVADLTCRLGDEVETAMSNANEDTLSSLLSRLKVLLHPGHQHCIAVSHSLIQLLSPNDPQKPDTCKRIVETTTRIDPYGSRLALYTAIALRELASCPGEDKKALLSRAVSLLTPEPKDSPGGKLLKLISGEISK